MLLPQMLQDPNLRFSLAICFGAIAGALSRYYITLYFLQRFAASFPYGTFLSILLAASGWNFLSP